MILLRNGKRAVIKLQVCGGSMAEEKSYRHPDNRILVVNLEENKSVARKHAYQDLFRLLDVHA